MKDSKIYNYRLVLRIRHNFYWSISFFIILLIGIILNGYKIISSSINLLTIFLGLYFLLYIALNTILIILLKRKIKLGIPFIPWFGIYPKQMLPYKEYQKIEISFFAIFSIVSMLFLFLVNNSFFILFYTFWFIFIVYRVILFIRIIRLKKTNLWIKYESFGTSVYQTD